MAVVSINYPSIADCEASPGAAGFDVGSTAIIGTSNFTLEVSSASIDHTTVLDAKIGGVRWLISANPATAMTALTGGVTAVGPGSAAATVHTLPLDATAVVAPSTPASGKGAVYVDSTSKNLAVKDDAGVVKHGIQTFATATSVITAINDAGLATGKTYAELAALIGAARSSTTTLVGAAQDIAVSGLTGDSDGGYDIEGVIVAPGGGQYYLQLNGVDPAGAESMNSFSTVAPAVATNGLVASLYLGTTPDSNPTTITFQIRIGSKSGTVQPFSCQMSAFRDAGTLIYSFNTNGQFTAAAEVTAVRIHGSIGATDCGIGSRLSVSKRYIAGA